MSLLEDLASGKLGARFRAPRTWERADESPQLATFVDRDRRLGWNVGIFDVALALRREDAVLLEKDIERHARELFERCFRMSPPAQPGLAARGPRTTDPSWSPVIEVARVAVGDAPALRVIHRLWYQPFRETVMGHVLVPLRRGTLELRVNATDTTTGMREARLLDAAFRSNPGKPMEQLFRELGSRHYDDPIHDAAFPEHGLSRVRAGLRGLLEPGVLAITEPAIEVGNELSSGSFSVTLPPRHAPMMATLSSDGVQCSRVSFAGTDGVELLTVQRIVPGRGDLRTMADSAARQVPDGATGLTVSTEALPAREGRSHVRAYRRFETESDGVQHSAMRWFIDAAGWCVVVALGTTTCVPEAELFERAESVVDSYRVLDATPPP